MKKTLGIIFLFLSVVLVFGTLGQVLETTAHYQRHHELDIKFFENLFGVVFAFFLSLLFFRLGRKNLNIKALTNSEDSLLDENLDS